MADESFELAEADGSGKSASVRARPGRSNKLVEVGIGTGAELSSVDMVLGTAGSGDRPGAVVQTAGEATGALGQRAYLSRNVGLPLVIHEPEW